MNENVIVKEYEFNEPLIHKIDFIIDNCIRDCHINYFHTFKYKCLYDIKIASIRNNETVNITIFDKNIRFNELKKNLKIA